MEQSFANEIVVTKNNETIEICINDAIMEEKKCKCENKNKQECRE